MQLKTNQQAFLVPQDFVSLLLLFSHIPGNTALFTKHPHSPVPLMPAHHPLTLHKGPMVSYDLLP